MVAQLKGHHLKWMGNYSFSQKISVFGECVILRGNSQKLANFHYFDGTDSKNWKNETTTCNYSNNLRNLLLKNKKEAVLLAVSSWKSGRWTQSDHQ